MLSEGGESYTVRYLITANLPSVMFVSTRTTASIGSHVYLTPGSRGEVLAGHLVVPLRIIMDLLRLLLTHDSERYTDTYHQNWSDSYIPVVNSRKCNPHPKCQSDTLGCYHMVAIGGDGKNTCPQAKGHGNGPRFNRTAGGDARVSKLPVTDGYHMRLHSIPSITCGIVRDPSGTVFLTTSGWGISTDRGLKRMMGAPGDYETQYAFPLCHTEHFPGLMAAFDKWLAGDYILGGLKISAVLPHDVSSVKTPEFSYTNEMDYWTDQWHHVHGIDADRRTMRRTVYDGHDLSVEPVYGAYRRTMTKCQ